MVSVLACVRWLVRGVLNLLRRVLSVLVLRNVWVVRVVVHLLLYSWLTYPLTDLRTRLSETCEPVRQMGCGWYMRCTVLGMEVVLHPRPGTAGDRGIVVGRLALKLLLYLVVLLDEWSCNRLLVGLIASTLGRANRRWLPHMSGLFVIISNVFLRSPCRT